MRGGLDLLVTADEAGRSVLRRQAFSPPIHISKPHHDAGWLVVNLASPSPGLLEGDCVEAKVVVDRGAKLLLTAPSANRIHATPNGFAELTQDFEVRAGGFLDIWPEYLIPQADSVYRQHSTLRVEPGGTLLWTETVAPGRVARGEVFEFREVGLATDLFVGERHVIRERYTLTPSAMAATRAVFPTAYYASIVCVSPALVDQALELRMINESHAQSETAWVGATQVTPEVWALKILAADSPTLRRMVSAIRFQILHALKITPANARRTTGEAAVTFEDAWPKDRRL